MTIRELAQLAGVSVSTVSKIMNQKDESISAETREHVMSLAKEYHYTPYASVAFRQSARSLCLGVLLKNTHETDLTLSGILSCASARGYSVLLRTSSDSFEEERKAVNAFILHRVDGLIWEPAGEQSAALAEELNRAEIPFLVSGSPAESDRQFLSPALSAQGKRPFLDFSGMGFFLTEKLIQKGHADIACLLMKGSRTEQFYEGYRRCLFEHQIPFRNELVFPFEKGIPFQSLGIRQFSGIVVSHYAAALKLYEATEALHYAVPYDLSIVTLRNDSRLPADYPPLSSLTIPHAAYGEQLCNFLIDALEKRPDAAASAQKNSLHETASPQKNILEENVSDKISQKANNSSFRLDHTRSIDVPFASRLKRILSIGSINIDNYLNMEVLPRSGKTVTAPASSMYLGGRCANEAIGAALLGHTVSMIGRVGHGGHADFIYSGLSDRRIDTRGVRRTLDANTGQAFIFVQRDGESMISVSAGANLSLTPSDILEQEYLFRGAGCCMLQTGIPMEVTLAAAETAKKHGLMTVLKPSSCSSLPERLISLTDIIVPNADEIDEICRNLSPHISYMEQKADYLLSCGAGTVIVTLGAQGCYIKNRETEFRIPAVPFPSVDNSGASDAFISALVSYLLYGYALRTAARIAAYAAGFSTTRQGVSPCMVDRSTLEAYIRQKEPALLMRS